MDIKEVKKWFYNHMAKDSNMNIDRITIKDGKICINAPANNDLILNLTQPWPDDWEFGIWSVDLDINLLAPEFVFNHFPQVQMLAITSRNVEKIQLPNCYIHKLYINCAKLKTLKIPEVRTEYIDISNCVSLELDSEITTNVKTTIYLPMAYSFKLLGASKNYANPNKCYVGVVPPSKSH